jgi:hypothetical protein
VLVEGRESIQMIISKIPLHILAMAVVSLGLTTSVRSASRVTLAVLADETHRQSTPSTQVTRGPSSAQIEVDPNSQPRALGLTTEQAAVTPPQVTYDDGQLTIIAENVSLSAVFDALRRVMGTNIEMPPGAANQLIWVRSGPGPARRVLRDLLDGTDLDYVIQASESDGEGVRSVLLSVRSKGGDTSDPGSSPARNLNRKAQPGGVSATDSPDMDTTPAENVASSGELAPSDPIAAAIPQSGAQSTPANVQLPSLGSKPSPAGSPEGSSEQMIQQLQTLYQQRRQMQMQQNQKLPTAN